jgi:hypothetical protein
MARLETLPREHQGETLLDRRSGGVAAILLAVIAILALAEIVASRSAMTVDARRPAAWERALQLGDEARARGDAAAARREYLAALFRARGDRSLAGVLGAAERFTALGDREVASHALSMATSLGVADRDPETQQRLEALRDQLQVSGIPSLAVRAPR